MSRKVSWARLSEMQELHSYGPFCCGLPRTSFWWSVSHVNSWGLKSFWTSTAGIEMSWATHVYKDQETEWESRSNFHNGEW